MVAATPGPPQRRAQLALSLIARHTTRRPTDSLSGLPLQITDEAIKAFLLSIDQATYVRLSQAHGHAGFPLAFPDDESELNFLSCLALLNGFSSFRAPLHKAVQRGTFDSESSVP